MLTCYDLFEIAVYRLAENKYNHELLNYISTINEGVERPLDEGYLREQYGGPWQYNEIMGYLRFYRYGESQIRCTYWETTAKRKVRTRKKTFVITSNSYCRVLFSNTASNTELANAMKKAVAHCENRLKNRSVDRRLFDSTVNHIDWKSVLS